ncbi:MAG: hypothetical protein O2955_04405 [Planctomycetota bacterium]|nr:hypothetical protein [Planctomycetota bacterium]MDA1211731.1 hypothetical protein [Planctomycetota bacterium]
MWRAMIYKELRELCGIAALATAALFLYSGSELRMSFRPLFEPSQSVPFLGDDWYYYFALIGIGFTILLGFKQTAWELWQGTFLFLFHRPARRNDLIVSKLTIGLAVYLICSALPIVCVALWAATPGTHASPFEWSMTLPMWWLWLSLTLIYLGAFTSGLIDGKWYGIRLMPLATSFLATTAVYFIPWWWVGLPLFVVSCVLYVTAILFVARTRDYS